MREQKRRQKMNNADRLKESLEKCGCIGAAVIGNGAAGRDIVPHIWTGSQLSGR